MQTRKPSVMVVLGVLVAAATAATAGVVNDARSSGVQGGLIVHLGCGDGRETAKLLLGKPYLVHGLDTDAKLITRARRHILDRKLYGKVSVAAFDGKRLPYVANLVNLLVGSAGAVPQSEVLRVLAPGGVAVLDGQKLTKPRGDDIDEWTHFLHGPDNNAVAADRRADIPRSLQWVAPPRWGRSHEELASMSAAVTAGGRVFFIVDEAPLATIRFLSHWQLVARDAFNGTLLWKKPIPRWSDHLRHFRSGPLHLPRRLVAVGDTVYVTPGLAAPVVALDAATGKEIRTYQGTERTEEILLDGGVLYLAQGTSEAHRRGGGLFTRGEPTPTDFRRIMAVDAETGKELWRRDCTAKNILPLSLTARGGCVYYQSTEGVICLDAKTGTQRWLTPRPTPQRRMSFSGPTVVATDGVLLVADRAASTETASAGKIEWGVHGWNEKGFPRRGKSILTAYDTAGGKALWSEACSEGYNSPVDVFVIDGVVWVGPGWKGLDLKTGEVKKQLNTKAPRVGMPHHRCYRNKATERFILTGKSGIEVLSLDKGWLSNNSWIRGTCQYGIMPANGMLYAPPDACACFLTVKAPGFIAVAPQRDKTGHLPFPAKPVIEKGPAYGNATAATAKAQPGHQWPMYRGGPRRGQTTAAALPASLTPKWTAELGGKLTQPVIGEGLVFVARSNAQTVYGLDATDGKEKWHFTADGRIDSSPTLYRGTLLFGSAGGWVYCLRAADGELMWRFQAAPESRFVCAYGQVESVWPVHGAVLVQNDTVYATAGRSSYMDGGIVLYCLNPATGEPVSRTVVYHLDPETGKQLTSESRFNMEGTTSDVLAGDGERVYLKYFAFDKYGKRTKDSKPHLFAIAGLLGEEWFVRSYWLVGQGMPGAGWGGWANAAKQFPAGRILCFDDKMVYGYGRKTVSGGPVGHKAEAYHLFAVRRKAPEAKPAPNPTPAAKPQPGKKRRRPKRSAARKPAPLWSLDKSLIVRAMVAGPRNLVVAGPVDVGRRSPKVMAFQNDTETLASFLGKREIFARVVARADGKTVSQVALPALPVFDGMAAAGGRIYLSLSNGCVTCLGR